ncbi:hypothetical protein ARALYDRAFT_893812 [Arabidopsis lyrata subsp. lyrata]|uniref:Uncharacterized protein n=1 Tax=Arabidopsis lyrata subsp. lyrata TaxID=81972 RepID=D7KZ18_ARALL|nr:hypothetical protein ARALYDRAFT_893812 [Arabidopsis lyrata subsp. lyrata]
MANHKVVTVVFACQEKCFVEAAIRPMAWPSFKAQSGAIKSFLRSIPEWKLVLETKTCGYNLMLLLAFRLGFQVFSNLKGFAPLFVNAVSVRGY